MNFTIDKQTMDDLNLVGKYRSDSIFNLFNHVKTAGGEKLLEQMFYNPMNDVELINNRSGIFSYFQSKRLNFPVQRDQFDLMENYLDETVNRSLIVAGINNFRKLILGSFVRDERYAQMQNGVTNTIQILKSFSKFIASIDKSGEDSPYGDDIKAVKKILYDKRLSWIDEEEGMKKLPFRKVNHYDYLFRETLKTEMKSLLQYIYHIDLYIAVGNTAEERKLSYAKALPKDDNIFKAEDLRHPYIKNAVGNKVSFHKTRNVMFLTGANMAGKSTLMKAFGIAIYLAHMGFPIAARNLEFSVKDGLYSSINVADDLSKGYSHFYAEVLRVKKVAQEVSIGRDMVVIFDELFKGTNVKDAYDATLSVTEAFADYDHSFFIISTHIIEVGDALEKRLNNIQFTYLPTVMVGNVPHYPYILENGITTDRQGMIIIENEGILEILES